MGSTLLDAALDYAARGWHVFPLKARDKLPATEHGFKDATTDPDQIRAWWQRNPRYNIGIATGAESGFVVVDTDNPDAEEYATMQSDAPTRRQTTAKGRHRLYKHPGYNLRNTTALHGVAGLDVRGDGGYIVAAPSVHPSGVVYVWENDNDLAPLPEWVTRKPEREQAPGASATPDTDAYAQRAYDALIGELVRAKDGTRNETLFKVARRVNEFVVAGRLPGQVFSEIESVALRTGLPVQEVTRTIASARNGGTPEDTGMPQANRRNGTTPEQAPDDAPETTPDADRSDILDALHRLGYTFRLNLLSDTVEVNGRPMNDIVAAEIRTRMRRAGFRAMEALQDEYTFDASQNSYHPIEEYLNSLEWDGGDYIRALADRLTCSDPDIAYMDGRTEQTHYIYLLRWLVGVVGKVFDRRQNGMLVLAGPQGIGKSELVRWLASGVPTAFLEEPINTSDKDSDVRLMSHWLWEVSELDATTRKADVSALKAFITKSTVVVRKAYGRHDTIKPALASFVGTVNNASGFLNDETGNRRFYVTTIEAIDWAYVDIPVDQLWAQAVALYRNGTAWRLTSEEAVHQERQNQQHDTETAMEGWLLAYFDLNGDYDDILNAGQIFAHLRGRGIMRHGTRADTMELSATLKRLGIVKDRVNGIRVYRGIRVSNTEDGSTDANLDNLPRKVGNQDSASERGIANLANLANHDGANSPRGRTVPDSASLSSPSSSQELHREEVGKVGKVGKSASESDTPSANLDGRLAKTPEVGTRLAQDVANLLGRMPTWEEQGRLRETPRGRLRKAHTDGGYVLTDDQQYAVLDHTFRTADDLAAFVRLLYDQEAS